MSRELSHIEYSKLLAQDNIIKLTKADVCRLTSQVTAISYYNFNKGLRLMGKLCIIYVVLAFEGYLYFYQCNIQEAIEMHTHLAYVIFEIV